MQLATDQSQKIELIRSVFEPLCGRAIEGYQSAEILVDGEWDLWADLPLRIGFAGDAMASVAWSKTDDLWLSGDESTHFQPNPETTRWIDGLQSELVSMIGRAVDGVSLGRGEMTVEGQDVEIWTRLIISLGDRWLEVFNALDENGYALHDSKPAGEFVRCI